jgi:hypothetical protein
MAEPSNDTTPLAVTAIFPIGPSSALTWPLTSARLTNSEAMVIAKIQERINASYLLFPSDRFG